MKYIIPAIVCAFAILLASTAWTLAVEGQALQVQGTNLVLYWPSPGGYQEYLIQYRQSLDPSTPWTELTNNYFANGTNFTTYTIVGAVPSVLNDGGGGDTNLDDSQESMSAVLAEPTEPLATPADGTGPIMPLYLYPPEFDMSRFLIYDPAVSNWVSGATYVRPLSPANSAQVPLTVRPMGGGLDDPQPADADPPSTGFYRVFHIPDWLFDATSYTYDGPWFFPVDFADYMDRVDGLTVLLNGQPTEDAEFMSYVYPSGKTNWGMGIYFDRIPSGTYQIQLISTLLLNNLVGEGSTYMLLSNLTATITVDNQVTFTNWDDFIWDTNYTFRAQTKTLATDWWIDIYDYWGYYVNGGSGHTTNGQIEWTWDLLDESGYPRDSLDSDPQFLTLITFTADGQMTTRYTPHADLPYPDTGYWLITFQDTFYTGSDAQYYTNGISAIAGGPASRQIPVSVYPLKFGTNGYTQADRDDSYAVLKAYMFQPQTRNFFYFGHANAGRIGDDMHDYDASGKVTGGRNLPGSKAFITSQTISNRTHLQQALGRQTLSLCFLDGCHTADGGLPGAFGVNKATNDYSFYTNSVANPKNRRPSVFMGWMHRAGRRRLGTVQTQMDFRSWGGCSDGRKVLWATERVDDAISYACSTSGWPQAARVSFSKGFASTATML